MGGEEPFARGFSVRVSSLEDAAGLVGTSLARSVEAQEEPFDLPHGWGREYGKEEPGIRQECEALLQAKRISEAARKPGRMSAPRGGL